MRLSDLDKDSIHHKGGTVLGTSREPLDLDAAVDFIVDSGVNQLYFIGGDGSFHAAHLLAEVLLERVRRSCF